MEQIGLTLSGGGAKGAYEIGVWGALEELGILPHITALSGTSVGALNAALLESRGTQAAKELWMQLLPADLLHVDPDELEHYTQLHDYLADTPDSPDDLEAAAHFTHVAAHGMPFSQERIAQLIDSVDLKALERPVYAVCTEGLVFRHEHVFHLQDHTPNCRRQILLASSALPVIYHGMLGVRVGSYGHFFDGGLIAKNNTPIDALYDNGIRRIIAVYLRNSPSLHHETAHPDAQILRIIPQTSMGGLLTGTLRLTPAATEKRIASGYADTMAMADELLTFIREGVPCSL